jgi:hypothetical protein
MGNTQSNNTIQSTTNTNIPSKVIKQQPIINKEIPTERIVIKPKPQPTIQENLGYAHSNNITNKVALNKMYYDEQDRLEQGNALNSYYQLNTTTIIPPAPNNMKNMMNLNSRQIPVYNNADEIYGRDSNILREEWNRKQKPQVNNTNLPNASIHYYDMDKEQLSNTKKSVPRPTLNNIQKSLDDIYRKYKGITSNERQLLVSKNITLTEIDPLYVLEKRPNITLTDLEQTYMKLRSIHHPDKGGDADTFIRIQNAINISKSVKCGSVIDKSYNDLRSGYQEYMKNNEVSIDDREERQFKKTYDDNSRFSLEKFNKAYEENRYIDDLEEHGYGSYMQKSQEDRDDINIENTIGKFKLQTFNEKFKNGKKKKGDAVIKYQVPESLDACDGIGHVLLGAKQENFTSSIKSRVNYTDYMDAYTKENVLVDETGLSNKINKPYKKALKEYKNASLKLTEEQEKAIEEYEEKKKKEEQNRMQRFNQMAIDYDKYEKKMSNYMLK